MGVLNRRLRGLSLFLLGYALLIIAWGAWVRISGSGDGCGKHWPLCQGFLVPEGDFGIQLQVWVEYLHRAKSGVFGILVVVLWALCWRAHRNRIEGFSPLTVLSAHSVLFFTISEALLGAALVMLGLVDQNQSLLRFVVIGLHLTNTLFLLGALCSLYVFIGKREPRFRWDLRTKRLAVVSLVGFCVIGISGSMAALSNTLFPSESLSAGLKADLQWGFTDLQKLRIFHPFLAIAFSVFLLMFAVRLKDLARSKVARLLPGLLVIAVLFGVITLLSLSPVWMKLSHLLIADLLWILFVISTLESMTYDEADRSNLLRAAG